MTICVAALCENNQAVVGASDRLLVTGSGTFKFEPPASKIYFLTEWVALLVAGSSSFHAEAINQIRNDFIRWNLDRTQFSYAVFEIAEAYNNHLRRCWQRAVESAQLAPLGLTIDDWISKTASMNPLLVHQLKSNLELNAHAPSSAILAGRDNLGMHLYVIDSGTVADQTEVGFAAVGSGAEHATSLFMLENYASSKIGLGALYLAYAAKRRAEASPSVGLATDVFTMTQNRPCQLLEYENLEALERIHDKAIAGIRAANSDAEDETLDFFRQQQKEAP